MEKLNYIETRIEEVKKSLSDFQNRAQLYWYNETIIRDLKKELTILESIRDDYKVKV